MPSDALANVLQFRREVVCDDRNRRARNDVCKLNGRMIPRVDKGDRFSELPAERSLMSVATCDENARIILISGKRAGRCLQRLAGVAADGKQLALPSPMVEMAPQTGGREIERPSAFFGEFLIQPCIVGNNDVAVSVS